MFLFLFFLFFHILDCFLQQVYEGRGKNRATRPNWLQDTLLSLLPSLAWIIRLGMPEDWFVSSLVAGKAVVHTANMGNKVVSARWKLGEIHLRFYCQLLILAHHLLQHNATHSVDRFCSGLAIH